jgi:hypothetical protein
MNYYYYLSHQDIADLKRYHKKAGFVQFHSMNFYIPCDTVSPLSYAVYSYYTCVGYVDNVNKTILLDEYAYNYSRTTTRQIRRFIKEFNLKEIKQ